MNTQPAQPVPADSLQPNPQIGLGCQCHDVLDCSEVATVAIVAAQLTRVAELLDGFLRSGNGAESLADYLHATGRDQPQPQNRADYDANLVIDLVSFTAHGLRVYRQGPLR